MKFRNDTALRRYGVVSGGLLNWMGLMGLMEKKQSTHSTHKTHIKSTTSTSHFYKFKNV